VRAAGQCLTMLVYRGQPPIEVNRLLRHHFSKQQKLNFWRSEPSTTFLDIAYDSRTMRFHYM